MVDSALRNIEETFAGIDETALKSAADDIWASRQVFVLGVGVNNSNARNFTYLASTGMEQFHPIPRPGSTAVDDLARADQRDVLIAITCKPYRSEVVDAVRIAREQGLTIVGISDSPASPIVAGSRHGFVVAADTPQFFPSSVSTHRAAGNAAVVRHRRIRRQRDCRSGSRRSMNAAMNWASMLRRRQG